MFDEISSVSADYQAPKATPAPQASNVVNELEALIREVFRIDQRQVERDERIAARFIGEFTLDPQEAFDLLDPQLARLDFHAFFRPTEDGGQQIIILHGRHKPKPRSWIPNAVLLVITIFSTMWAGATIDGASGDLDDLIMGGGILRGWVYALCLLLILGAHELGHYFAARHHKINVTLPYFIPLPIGIFGTMGAFIQLREPVRNRRQLFDVGVSGPLAGLVFAIPILFIGIATAQINPLPTEEDCREEGICGYVLEGNSLFYAAAKYLVHGELLPGNGRDLTLNQMAFAGWTGLFVTALNLIPIGQLDGGHVMYTLFGRYARRAYIPALIALAILALFNPNWVLWVFLLFFFGRVYAEPMNDLTPLDSGRRRLGFIVLAFFFLIFTPSPLTVISLT